MQVLVGTSGYAYKEWKGIFYPEDLPAEGMLRFYGGQFQTVEINNTFYRLPSEKMILNWAAQVPDAFTFVLKASRRITHMKRLKDVKEPLDYLLHTSSVLGDKLGPTLFQLPPNMKKDVPRLQHFLELLPKRWRAALEFRNVSWYDDEVFDTLRSHNAALCLADTEDKETPVIATADWGYLRLRRGRYDEEELLSWSQQIADQPWQNAFVFFKHEDQGVGPKLAKQFIDLLPTNPADGDA